MRREVDLGDLRKRLRLIEPRAREYRHLEILHSRKEGKKRDTVSRSKTVSRRRRAAGGSVPAQSITSSPYCCHSCGRGNSFRCGL